MNRYQLGSISIAGTIGVAFILCGLLVSCGDTPPSCWRLNAQPDITAYELAWIIEHKHDTAWQDKAPSGVKRNLISVSSWKCHRD